MKIGSIYSASDKSLFDALTQSAVTNAELRKLFFTHGIVISKDTPRKQLAKHFSRLIHDYADYQALARLFDTGQRRERLSSVRVKTNATVDDFEHAAGRLIDEISQEGNIARLQRKIDGTLSVEVTYKKFHFDKNEFKQTVTKNASIDIENRDGVLLISGPQNVEVAKWCRQILDDVRENVTENLDIEQISLINHVNPNVRTKFFTDLTKNIEGFIFDDVSDVYLHRPKAEVSLRKETELLIDAETVDSAESLDDLDDEQIELGVHISRASLRGQGVLASKQMLDLLSQGFYISKIVWTSKSTQFDSDLYEFEAQFSEPETCTMFSYAARGYYGYKGAGEYNASRTQFSKVEDSRLGRLIEAGAYGVLKAL
jgi:hypothetical protein